MPAKKETLTDAERRKRIRDAAREHETSDDPADLDRALKRVAPQPSATPKASS